jgi:hypothetical protein
MRRKYIPAYVECLQQNRMGGNEETKKMDEELPEATILLFRRLAHTQVASKRTEVLVQTPVPSPSSTVYMADHCFSLPGNRLRVTSAKLQQPQQRSRAAAGSAGSAAPRRQSRTSRRSRLRMAS